MAYFPNGSSFYDWQEGQCYDCVNYRDNGSGSYGCAITDAHFLMADKMHEEGGKRSVVFDTLDILIPDETAQCAMRLTDDMLTALAAGTRSAETRSKAQSEGCQSGDAKQRNAQTPSASIPKEKR